MFWPCFDLDPIGLLRVTANHRPDHRDREHQASQITYEAESLIGTTMQELQSFRQLMIDF